MSETSNARAASDSSTPASASSTSTSTAGASTAGASIEFKNITKKYRGQSSPAVDNLSLEIPAGELVAFVGPSGCGKTTSLKMINRLVEPTSGQLLINGDDAIKRNPTELRRQIGYVIQGGGLLPHISVADNIALVPSLLKWPKAKITKRTDELLEMVGLDPSIYRDRFPRELSGGQQQRVGVARGLAADPPVVLMDEPFGAVDPITRARLQDELVNIQSELGKTIVVVTHDIDEAIKLGHRILILEPGAKIAQYDTPEHILAAPASDFVEDFIGSGSALKQLNLRRVDEFPLEQPPVARIGDNAAEAVRRARDAKQKSVVVLDNQDRPREWVQLRQLERVDRIPEPKIELSSTVDARSTVSDAMSAMLASSHGGAMVTRRGKYIGVISYDTVNDYIRSLNAAAAHDAADDSSPKEVDSGGEI